MDDYATLTQDECDAIGVDGRDGRGTITYGDLTTFEQDRLTDHRALLADEEDRQSDLRAAACSTCGATETVERHQDAGGYEQSIAICANCGSDES